MISECPVCKNDLHVDTGSILDFEEGLIKDPVFFCTNCGYDSEKPQVNSTSTEESKMQKEQAPPTAKFFSQDYRTALAEGRCPYCDTDELSVASFRQESGRRGGFEDCSYCKVLIAWIDSPFEATELFY